MQTVTLVPVERQPFEDDIMQENIVYDGDGYTFWSAVRPGKYQPQEITAPEGTIGVTKLNEGTWVWLVKQSS